MTLQIAADDTAAGHTDPAPALSPAVLPAAAAGQPAAPARLQYQPPALLTGPARQDQRSHRSQSGELQSVAAGSFRGCVLSLYFVRISLYVRSLFQFPMREY